MSDKIVNVYVGECFKEGSQVGGEGKTYGLSLTGNKLKLVENGQQSEVDLPASGGGASDEDVKAFNQLMFMLAQVQYNSEKIFSSPAGQYTVTLSGNGDIDNPYKLNVVVIDKELSAQYVSFSDIYNSKSQFMVDVPEVKSIISRPLNLLYGETLVNRNGSLSNLDFSKLPQGIRSFQLTIQYV